MANHARQYKATMGVHGMHMYMAAAGVHTETAQEGSAAQKVSFALLTQYHVS